MTLALFLRKYRFAITLTLSVGFFLLVSGLAFGQVPSTPGETGGGFNGAGPSTIANTFYNATQTWLNGVKEPARELFWALAGIDLTWTCITLVLQHNELQAFMAGFIRKLLTIGFFAVLLENGFDWITAIVNFFINVGGTVGGVSPSTLSASGIMGAGVQLAGHMLKSAAGTASSTSTIGLLTGFSSSISTALILALGALVIIAAYVIIALHFVIAMVEAYVVIGAGYIFLGFGGSRWTVPYTEKYIGQVVSAGVRIFVLELMIGLGGQLYQQWDQMAQQIGNIPDLFSGGTVAGAWTGVQLEFALLASIAIFGLLCWTVPQIAANVVSGGLSMSGTDVIGAAAAGGTAGFAAASFANSGSQDTEASKSAVGAVQAAAVTAAQMGVQAGVAAATGGAGAAAAGAGGAGAGVGGGGVSAFGGGPGGGSVGGGMGAGMDGKTPPVPGGGGGGSGSSADSREGTPPVPGGGNGKSGDLVGALHGLAKDGQSALRQMPGGSAQIRGTSPNMSHGE